jgi:hypothetical protein
LARRGAFVERFIVEMAMPRRLHDECQLSIESSFGYRPSRRSSPYMPH